MSSAQLNKSLSDPNVAEVGNDRTPPNYISVRSKRMREEDLPTEFCKFKEEMKEMFKSFMTAQKTELKVITANLKEIQQTNFNIEASVARLSTQNEEFQRKIESLELQAKKDREYIAILEDTVEDLQRSSRKSCIELKNVPRAPKETSDDLINMVLCLSKKIGLDLVTKDIKDIHRVQGKKVGTNNTPIIVELGSSIIKSDMLRKTKSYNIKNKTKLQAKHLGLTSNEDTPVFISEQLTAKGARLFFLARDLAKTNKYKFCWTAFGRVFVKKDENSRAIIIKSEAQVHQLLQNL